MKSDEVASEDKKSQESRDAERWRYWRDHHGWSGYFDDGLTNSENNDDIDAACDAAISRLRYYMEMA